MDFNIGKCKVLHIGHGNGRKVYHLNGHEISAVSEEKDLGVIMAESMKVGKQCAAAALKANRVLGMMRRTLKYKTKDVITRLYKSLVRPHLEYCIQAWRPHLVKDINVLERVQHRATKMIPELSHMCYEDRLKECGLISCLRRY